MIWMDIHIKQPQSVQNIPPFSNQPELDRLGGKRGEEGGRGPHWRASEGAEQGQHSAGCLGSLWRGIGGQRQSTEDGRVADTGREKAMNSKMNDRSKLLRKSLCRCIER